MTMLRRTVGEKIAFDLATTGRLMNGSEAAAAGLVSRVYEDSDFAEQSAEVLRVLADASPSALAFTKQQFYQLDGLGFDDGLRLGADVNAVDANGETAMHGAALKNLPKVVQFLADNGAKVEVWNKPNDFGSTPLMLAQGYRPGNFKPSFETVEAIQRVMHAAGVTPPTNAQPASAELNNSDWAPPKPKKQP